RAVSAVVTPIVQAATTVYHAAQTVYHAAVSAGTWLVNQAKAAVSAIGRGIVTVVRNAGAALRSAGQALRSGYNRYIAPTVNSVRNYAAQKAAQIRAAAIAVKDHAKATIAKAVAHVPLKQLGAAVKAGLKSTLSKITISVNAALPSITASFSNVVQDYAAAAKSLYAGAVAAGSAVVSGVQAAGDWVVDHKAEIIGGIAGAVVGVGCGALIGVTGVGAVACAAAGGAVGSLVTDLVEGGKGWKEMAADAVLGGTIGAVMGPLSSIGGSAVSGAVRGLISGGAREALSMGGAAAASSLRSFGSRQVGGVVGKALANRSAGSAAREAVESTGAGVRSSVRVDAGDTCNSFAVGTAVLMADGTSKAIEQVKVGDMVLATDPTTGKSEPRKVTALVVGVGTKRMVDLTVDVDGARGDRTATLSATDGHPFWAPDLQRWVTAGELRAGSLLQTGTGTYVQVTATRSWTATTKEVRNLTVDVAHTYYVVAGGTRILVHNCASADLLGYAETLRPNAGKKGIMFAAKYTSPSGRSYFGYNGHDVMPKPGGVMETAVEQLGKPGHQYCAETMCLMLAEKAEGDAAFGGVMEVIKVRGLQSPPGGAHGTPASPCSESCRPRLADLEIDHIMGQR
uniref:polymorphic toxin-type HINT domain-containing protein n=1 Tax=Symbioplanes lichenis TaxID=1629072 RepID=UPI002739A76B